MSAHWHDEARGMFADGIPPHKIAWVLGVSDFSVRYVLDHKGERSKSHARVRRWRERRSAELSRGIKIDEVLL
jgi:hypothetical protein